MERNQTIVATSKLNCVKSDAVLEQPLNATHLRGRVIAHHLGGAGNGRVRQPVVERARYLLRATGLVVDKTIVEVGLQARAAKETARGWYL